MKSDGTKWKCGWRRGTSRVLFAGLVAAGFGLASIPAHADSGEEVRGSAATISAGVSTSCAVSASRYVWCWGDNSYGQFGDGTQLDSKTPVPAVGIDDVVAVSTEFRQTCALRSSGEVFCWGLVNGRVRTSPQFMVAGATSVSVGGYLSCAVLSSGDASCWGFSNELGFSARVPTLLPGFKQIRTISVSQMTVCALGLDTIVRCAGTNIYGGLGDGTPAVGASPYNSAEPVDVLDPSGGPLDNVVALSNAPLHACALRSNGDVLCWGWNYQGQVGSGSGVSRETRPVLVRGIGRAHNITVGTTHSCALVGKDTVCWGYDVVNQLNGVGSSPVPVDVGQGGVIALTAGNLHTCGWTTAGEVRCWGSDRNYQLGQGTNVIP